MRRTRFIDAATDDGVVWYRVDEMMQWDDGFPDDSAEIAVWEDDGGRA